MADRRLGLFLGRASAEAALVERGRWRRRPRVVARSTVRAEGPLWQEGLTELAPLLRKLLRALPPEALRADTVQRIALPDPLIGEDRLSFRDLPADPDEMRELILWRIAREHRKPPESLACAFQVEKRVGDDTEVLVRIVQRDLLEAVLDAAGAAGIFPTRLDGWSGFALARPGVTEAPAGPRLWANDDWWSLMCWARAEGAQATGETLVHAEWHDPEASPAALAARVARLAKSFALSSGAGRLPLDLDLPDRLAAGVREGLSDHAALLSPVEATPLPLGGADCVALDTA